MGGDYLLLGSFERYCIVQTQTPITTPSQPFSFSTTTKNQHRQNEGQGCGGGGVMKNGASQIILYKDICI